MSSVPDTYYMIVYKSWLKNIGYESESKPLIKMVFNHCIEKRGYFFTDKFHILDFINDGDTIVSLKLPQNFDNLIIVRDGEGWRTNQIIVENYFELNDIRTVRMFHIKGVNDQRIVDLAIRYYLDVGMLYHLSSLGVELESNISYIHWWIKVCSDFKNPERIFVRKLLELTPFYVVAHGLARNKKSAGPNRAPFETHVYNVSSGEIFYIQNFHFTDASKVMKNVSREFCQFVYKITLPHNNDDHHYSNSLVIREVSPNFFQTDEVVGVDVYDLTDANSYGSLLDLGFNIYDLTIHALKKNWINIVCLLINRHNFNAFYKVKLLFIATALGYENMVGLLLKYHPISDLYQVTIDTELSFSFIMHHDLNISKVADLPIPKNFISILITLATVGNCINMLISLIKKSSRYFNSYKQTMIMYAKHYSKPTTIALLENYSINCVDDHTVQ